MIDQRLDLVVWLTVLLLFVLLGARAWAVETAESSHYRTSARVRVLNGAVATSIVALVVMMTVQGGATLVTAIVTSTDPRDLVTVVGDDDAPNEAPGDPDDAPQPVDPAAPPADPNAPPADPNAPPAGDPGAGAGAPPAPPGG